jgi:hypothetical protein
MFHLHNTWPHPSSSTLGGSSQLTLCNARPTTVLLFPYSKQDLPLSCIPRHHPNTLCIILRHLYFSVNPASVECCSLHTSGAMTLFSCRFNVLLIKLVGHWHSDATLCYLQVQSCPIIPGQYKLILAGGNPQLLVKTANMPIPNPFLFVANGCQDYYCSPGLA